MKRFFVVLMFIALTISAGASTFSTAGTAAPLPVQETPFTAVVVTGTATFNIVSSTTTALPAAAVPAGSKRLLIIETGTSAVNWGPSTVATTATGWPQIASGGTLTIDIDPQAPLPVIYFIPSGGPATATLRVIGIK